MNELWSNITRDHVLKAIQLFERQRDDYPKPRNTFLIHNGKKYPAKHIRGLAYQVANKKQISKDCYSGGQESANFFKRLGFTVEYKKEILIPKAKHKIARLVVTGKQYDRNGNPIFRKLQKIIIDYLSKTYKKKNFEFILTPGGFLQFEWPKELKYDLMPMHLTPPNSD